MVTQAATVQPDHARVVMWELTRACKLSCLHCAVGAQQRRSPLELSTYEAYKTIDQIVVLQAEEWLISGGDPLEREDIYQLLDYARRRGLQPSMATTATPGLTGAVIGKLKRNGLGRLVVSIDSSVPERHDNVRGINGQFASTLLAIRWARTAALPVEVNTLINRQNAGDLETIAHLLSDLGIQRWNVYFIVPIGESRRLETIPAEEFEKAFESLQEIGSRVSFPIRTFEAPHYRRFLIQKVLAAKQQSIDRYFDEASLEDPSLEAVANHRALTDRRDVVFVSHTGEVSVSAFLPMSAGNVRYQPLSSLYRSSEMFVALRDHRNLKGKCGKCEFRRICGGSRARAFALTGDLFASDPLCSYRPGDFMAAGPDVMGRDLVTTRP